MSFANERNVIEVKFKDGWSNLTNPPPVAYENVNFTMPVDSPWVRLNILNGASGYRAINNLKRWTGVIIVQIFVPSGSGTKKARVYADEAATIFDSKRFNDIVCNVASINSIGVNNAFYQMNVSIPFWRDG